MKTVNMFPALLLVVAMMAIAEHSGQKEIIFPEIAALALGGWIMRKPPWQGPDFHFWLSPTLAALTGILIVRFFSYEPFFMTIGAFCLVALQLKLLRSAVLPSVSAAILPIITCSESWYYPLSVCVLTGAIAIGRRLMNRGGPAQGPLKTLPLSPRSPATVSWSLPEIAHWARLLGGVVLVTGIAVGSGLLFMIAPPLIVAFVELSKPGGALRDKGGKALFLLVSAAFAGVFWLQLVHEMLHGPLWLSACAAAATVFLLYHALRLPFPPAVAIALLPTIIPQESLASYPLHVLAGSAVFVILSKACFGYRGVAPGSAPEEPVIRRVSAD
jgi:hypothetical protein